MRRFLTRKRSTSQPENSTSSRLAVSDPILRSNCHLRRSEVSLHKPTKITVQAVLNDEYLPPYSFADFFAFLKKEHSEENIEFFKDIELYRAKALPIYNAGPVLRSSNSSDAGTMMNAPSVDDDQQDGRISRDPAAAPPDSAASGPSGATAVPCIGLDESAELYDGVDVAHPNLGRHLSNLRTEVDKLLTTYLLENSEKEINLPQTIRKRILSEVRDRNNYHPDLFEGAVENVTTMMRLSSFPNFLKYAMPKDGGVPRPNLVRPKPDAQCDTSHVIDFGLSPIKAAIC